MNLALGIIKSFYSRRWYREFAKVKRKRAYAYAFLMFFIVWLLISVRFGINFNHVLTYQLKTIGKQIPTLVMKEGRLTSQKEKPTVVYFPLDDKPFALIRLDNPPQDFANSPYTIYVGAKGISFKGNGKIHHYTYAKNESTYVINSQTFVKMLSGYKNKLFFIIFLVVLIVGYLFFSSVALLLAWLVAPFIKSSATSLDYTLSARQAHNLAMAATTPCFLLLALAFLFECLFAPVLLALIIVFFAYPIYAVAICRKAFK